MAQASLTRIIIAAPFGIEKMLDPRTIATRSATEVRASINRDLAAHGGWTRPGDGDGDERYRDYAAVFGRELRDSAPQWLAEREPASLLTEALEDPGIDPRPSLDTAAGPLQLRLTAVHLGFIDAGFGALWLDYDIVGEGTSEPGAEAAPEARGEVDGEATLSLVRQFTGLVARSSEQFCSAVTPDLELPPQLHHRRPSQATILWAHLVYAVDGPPSRATLEPFAGWAPTAERDERPVLELDGLLFAPGLGFSLLAGVQHAEHEREADAAETVAATLALAQAYYAACAYMERFLVRKTGAVTSQRTATATELAADNELLEVLALRRGTFNTLDVHLAASTATESRLWSVIGDVWHLDRILAAVDGRMSDLRDTNQHLERELSDRRSNVFVVAALLFTMITVLSTFLDVVDFGQQGPLAQPDRSRSVLSAVLVATLVLLAGWLLYRNRPAATPGRRGPRSGEKR